MELSLCFKLGKALRKGDADAFFETYDPLLQVQRSEISENQLAALKEVARQISELPQDDFSVLQTATHTPEGNLLIDMSTSEYEQLTTQLSALVEKQRQEVSCSDSGAVSDFDSSVCDGGTRSRSNSMQAEENIQQVSVTDSELTLESPTLTEKVQIKVDELRGDTEIANEKQPLVAVSTNEETTDSVEAAAEFPSLHSGEKLSCKSKTLSVNSLPRCDETTTAKNQETNNESTSSHSVVQIEDQAVVICTATDTDAEWSVIRSRRKSPPQPNNKYKDRSTIRRGSPIQTQYKGNRHREPSRQAKNHNSEETNRSRSTRDFEHNQQRFSSRRKRYRNDYRKPFKSRAERSYQSYVQPQAVLTYPVLVPTAHQVLLPTTTEWCVVTAVPYQQAAEPCHGSTSTTLMCNSNTEEEVRSDKSAVKSPSFNYKEVVKFLWKGWTKAHQELHDAK